MSDSEHFVVEGEAVSSVYGPVESRRHGLSLGVNVGLHDHKVCTWSCLYCQCGFGEKREFRESEVRISVEDLLLKIKDGIAQHPLINAVTLAGNTEPGTYPEIAKLLKGLKKLQVSSRGRWKIIILSNGSELDRPEVQQAFQMADEVWIKLDVGSDEAFHRLSRPIAKVGTLADHLARMKLLKTLRIQTLIWGHERDSKLSNSDEANLENLLNCYRELAPVAVHLTTVARHPAMLGVVPVEKARLEGFAERIRELKLSVEVLV